MKQTNRKGFTLAELLIVVAIIAVLVAIAIPVFTAQKLKAEIAVDQANIRAYYSELQLDFIQTRKIDDTKLNDIDLEYSNGLSTFVLSGSTIKLKAGTYWVSDLGNDLGYNILYYSKMGNVFFVLPEN